MHQKSKFFYAKFCLLVTIIGLPLVDSERKTVPVSFKDDWFSKDRTYNRVIVVIEHLGKTLDSLINLPRNRNTSDVKYNLLTIFDFLYGGFEFIEEIIRDKKVDYYIMRKVLFAPNYSEITNEFHRIILNIDLLFDHTFFLNRNSFEDYNNIKIHKFLNDTIYNLKFRSDLQMTNYFESWNTTQSLENRIDKNIFEIYFKTLQDEMDNEKLCNTSIAKSLFDFCEHVLIAILKGFTMVIVGYEFHHVRQSDFTLSEIQRLYYDQFQETLFRVKRYAKGILSLITPNHRLHRACDPEHWKEGKNYIRVKNFVSSLKKTSSVNLQEEYKRKYSFKLTEITRNGYECRSFNMHSRLWSMSIDSMSCPEIFEIDPEKCTYFVNDQALINITALHESRVTCYSGLSNYHIQRSCSCDKHSDVNLSIRTLDLREHYINSSDYWVVTGIRFVVKNNEISIEIQEGHIAYGSIDQKTVRWNTNKGHPPKKGPETVKLGYKIKSFNLDDIELPADYFVTGARFELQDDNHVTLVVRGTNMVKRPFVSDWFYPQVNPGDQREQIDVKDYRNSAESDSQNDEVSHSGFNYVDLCVGILSTKNLPVIPFLDSQDLESKPQSPLGGLGLIYKGRTGYGGFLAFRLMISEREFKL